ncbi:MAG: hypothetical protein C0467_12215 [Planctomycetaceae bacterium]|nr:hypothetical protein [Planctomycetaceae bacterium]
MNRWFWKRWIWAVLVGTTAAVGLTMAQQGGTDAPSGPPKVGDVITLKFRDLPDRQVKVLKSEKQPDGSILSEVKDTKSGETFTLMDKPDPSTAKPDTTPKPAVSKAAPKTFEPTKSAEPPKVVTPPKIQDGPFKAKPRTSDPLVPPLKDALPNLPKDKDQEQEKERERRFFPALGKSNAAPTPPEPEEEKPGLLKRVFGRKKPTPPATPTPPVAPTTPTASTSAKPVASPSTPLSSVPRSSPIVTLEPPRTQPVRPVEPPTPLTPVPVSLPTGPTAPSIPTPPPAASPPSPIPLPLPAIPSVPGVGIPAPGGLPSIPIPPSGMSVNGPIAPVPPAPMKPLAMAETPASPSPMLPSKPVAVVTKPKVVMEAKALAPEAVKESVVLVAKQPVAIAPMPSDVVTAARMVPAPASALAPVVNLPVTQPQDSAITAMMRDIESHVKALENGIAPSQRAMAARAMCGGRHGSSDTVKMTVFRAAQKDPNPMVRAVCIEELCKLGYFEPAFEVYLTKACDDSSEEVRKAAKAALTQMTPRR